MSEPLRRGRVEDRRCFAGLRFDVAQVVTNVGEVDPFSAVGWFWRAVRAHSLTMAALFAFSLFGLSVLGWFRHALHRLGAPWYIWLVLPFAVVALLVRKEAEWVPDPVKRRKWARRLMFGAIALVLLAGKLAPDKRAAVEPKGSAHRGEYVRPPGK